MSKDYQAKQAALVAEHIKKQDIVITTALIPGPPGAEARLRGRWSASMKPGSVHRRSRGRARRQCRGREAGRGRRGRRRQDRRPHSTSPAGCAASRLGALRQEPVHLPRDPDRQEDKTLADQLGRRNRQRHRAHPRRRRRPSRISCRRARRSDETSRAAFSANHPSPLPGGGRRSEETAIMRSGRSLRLPALDFRAGDLRRLLRRLVGDAGAAHAADVGDQRDLLGDRGRRAARGRRGDGRRRADRYGRARSASSRSSSPSVNIFGGFLVTQRMLAMYKKKKK